jgi:hypothetical protein
VVFDISISAVWNVVWKTTFWKRFFTPLWDVIGCIFLGIVWNVTFAAL